MTNWQDTYDAVFFISIGTLIIGFFGLVIKTCLRSKCEHFSLCYGLITVDRRVDLEMQEDLARIEHGLSQDVDEIPQTQQPTQSTRRPSNTTV